MSFRTIVPALIDRYRIISDQVGRREFEVILRQLEQVLDVSDSGAIVEFGCYVGTTSVYIQRLLDTYGQREFHVYDSFAGLPDKSSQDLSPAGEQFKIGELTALKKYFIMNFKKAGLKLPHIHKGWFSEISGDDVPDTIAFAFLDGDYYESIMDSLKLIWPKLAPGAVIIVDDYMNEALPGAQKAVDEWIATHPARVQTAHSLAIIHT